MKACYITKNEEVIGRASGGARLPLVAASIVTQGRRKRALVVSNVEVEDSTTCAASELFCDLFCKGRNARMLDCYCVERFETVNEAKTRHVLFDNTEPM